VSFAAGRDNVVELSEKRKGTRTLVSTAPVVPDPVLHLEQLSREVNNLQGRILYIRDCVEPDSLAGSLVGMVGNSAEEIRVQLRPLREALKPEGGDAA
jgi:hypothetical protein